jgi:D-alanyl-lipoteichoic acid acyltransferase DltB (MBOAT superfamily)
VHFITLQYLYLVLGLLAIYYLPILRRFQVYILIIGSLIFYGSGQLHLLPLLTFTALSAGIFAWFLKNDRFGKKLVTFCVVLYLGILAFFKYKFLPFFNVESYAANFATPVEFMLLLPLPIGISFYVFQAISLSVDAYKDEYKPVLNQEKRSFHFIRNCFFYIIFFPQLVAGPIVKAHEFLPQIKPKFLKDVDYELALKTIICGLFFKSVIADNLNVYTQYMNQMVANVEGSPLDATILLTAYSGQIYADFFGYSLLAIGVGALFGYKLPDNFNIPYISQSIAEFWRRWHISLSSFLREYLYFPLGGNRKGNARTYINLIIVMGLGGLWHGAALSFMFWGLFHGIGLAIERPFLKTKFYASKNIFMTALRIAMIFVFVSFAWIFFKFPNFADVQTYMGAFVAGSDAKNVLNSADIMAVGLLCLPVLVQHVVLKAGWSLNRFLENVVYGLMLFFFFVQRGETDAFIYFQF